MELNSTRNVKGQLENPAEESGFAARDYRIVVQTEARGKTTGYGQISPFPYIACLRTQNRTVSQRSRDINEAPSRVLMMLNTPLAAFPGFFTRGCVLSNHRKPSCRRALAQGRTVCDTRGDRSPHL